MDLSTYELISGKTITDEVLYTAHLDKARRKLESMLGYTLDPVLVNTNLYNELGKTTTDFACPIVNIESLDDPDPVVTAYRLYDYNPQDPFLHVDPFTTINAVKLVYVRQGASPNGITVKTFDDDYIRQHQGRDAWSKYIGEPHDDFHWAGAWNISWGWGCYHDHHVQLAVDAVWQFETIPDDLLDVWADMVTYRADSKIDVKSETILTHSYTKYDREAPEYEAFYGSVISRYAGPHGTASRIHTL